MARGPLSAFFREVYSLWWTLMSGVVLAAVGAAREWGLIPQDVLFPATTWVIAGLVCLVITALYITYKTLSVQNEPRQPSIFITVPPSSLPDQAGTPQPLRDRVIEWFDVARRARDYVDACKARGKPWLGSEPDFQREWRLYRDIRARLNPAVPSQAELMAAIKRFRDDAGMYDLPLSEWYPRQEAVLALVAAAEQPVGSTLKP